MIQVFSNSLGDEELKAAKDVFAGRWVGKGKQCDAFEKEFAQHLKIPKVILTNNCTAAIYIALRALNIGPGDEGIISSVNFVACANALIDLGAKPVFADVHPQTLNILPEEIERLTTPRTKVVILLHYGGHPCPMDDIYDVCRDDISIMEDSANAVSSSYKDKMCGTLGDAGVFSFDAMKILVMVDGGALVIKDEEAFRRARTMSYLGLKSQTTSGQQAMKESRDRWWEYDLELTSGRFISNDVLASIGREQLKKLPTFISRRKSIWDTYQNELADIPGIRCPPEPLPGTSSSYYLYWLQLPRGRDELATYLAENGVYTTFRYFPLHMVNFYGGKYRLPNSEKINETTLNLPLHQNLTDSDVQKVCELVKNFSTRYYRRKQ